MSDEIICIDMNEMPDWRARFVTCKRFINGSFYFGVYKYARPGSLSDCIVLFKVARDERYKIQSVIEDTAAAAQQAPILLSRRETSDYVFSIQSKTGVNKKLAAGILQLIMPDGTYPAYSDTTGSEKMSYIDIQHLII